jgi:hypothetical protein
MVRTGVQRHRSRNRFFSRSLFFPPVLFGAERPAAAAAEEDSGMASDPELSMPVLDPINQLVGMLQDTRHPLSVEGLMVSWAPAPLSVQQALSVSVYVCVYVVHVDVSCNRSVCFAWLLC